MLELSLGRIFARRFVIDKRMQSGGLGLHPVIVAYVARGIISEGQAYQVAPQAGRAHRDIKPSDGLTERD